MSTTETPARRWALLLPALALAILTVSLAALAACQLAGQSAFQGSSRSASAPSFIISAPHTGSATATPTGAPFTIGAWPSDSMPRANEHVIIYVLCRIQDPTMSGPGTPAAGITVQVRVLDPINWSYSGTTNSDGMVMARVPIALHAARLGRPVTVDVAATWRHVTYQSQTSFTPAPGRRGRKSHPSGSGTPTYKGTPPPVPTSGPSPKATATPNAGPQPTPPAPTPPAPTPPPQPPPPPTASPASP